MRFQGEAEEPIIDFYLPPLHLEVGGWRPQEGDREARTIQYNGWQTKDVIFVRRPIRIRSSEVKYSGATRLFCPESISIPFLLPGFVTSSPRESFFFFAGNNTFVTFIFSSDLRRRFARL